MKTLITIFLFLATLMVFGQDKFQTELMKYANQNINLTTGIQVITPAKQSYTDFSNLDTTKFSSYLKSATSTNNSQAIVGFETVKFYNLDFSEDPFDGKLQVLVMGEPLPSPLTTLICCFGVIGILLYCKKKKEVIA